MSISYRKILDDEKDHDLTKKIAEQPEKIHKEYNISESIFANETIIPDIDQPIEDNFYLIRQRIENLEMQISKSAEEILELETLKKENQQALEDLKSIPEDLGKPSKIDVFKAAIAAKAQNIISEEYDGAETEDHQSNKMQAYTNLFKDSWLNKKSIKFLDAKKKTITNYKAQKNLSIFDVFDKDFVGTLLHRCTDIARSPIYEEMQEMENAYCSLDHGIEIKLTDKSAQFLVPLSQFRDIPKVTPYLPEYIEFTMILPPYAHEKKRYFQKGAAVEGFIKYLEKLDIPLSDMQKDYFKKLNDQKTLRLYSEIIENEKDKMIRSYFLNITGISEKEKNNLEERLFRFFKESEILDPKRILPTKNFPEWMKKIGGIIIERTDGQFEKFKKPQKIAVDPQLNGKMYKELLFLPSKRLIESSLAGNEWQEAFKKELRLRYKQNSPRFRQYAQAMAREKVEFVCTCENTHQERCGVPVLQEIFSKINYLKNEEYEEK